MGVAVPDHEGESREQRIAKFVRAAASLRDGKPIDPATARELGSAILAEIVVGKGLAQRLGLTERGSHATVAKIARAVGCPSSVDDGKGRENPENITA